MRLSSNWNLRIEERQKILRSVIDAPEALVIRSPKKPEERKRVGEETQSSLLHLRLLLCFYSV